MSGGSKNNGTPETEEARELYRLQADIGRQAWDEWKSYGSPMLAQLSEDAQQGLDAADVQERIGAAGADVTRAYGKAREGMAVDLGRMGVNPASGRYVGMNRGLRLAEAADTAGAMTRERRIADDVDYDRKLNLVGLASGQGAQAMAGTSGAARGLAGIGAQREQARQADKEAAGGLVGTTLTAGATVGAAMF